MKKYLRRSAVQLTLCGAFFVLFNHNCQSQEPWNYKAISKANQISEVVVESAGFYNLIESLPKNFVKDASVDYTSFIQKALDKNRKVKFPDFPILINEEGLNISNNSTIIFPKGGKVYMEPNSLGSYAVFKLRNVVNVQIFNPVIIGERDKHVGKTGEWGMGISIEGGRNIVITNAHISKCWGDGIYITNAKTVSNNIEIKNSVLDYNRRNGLTITGGKNILIQNLISTNTYGTLPMAGIDIEPNNSRVILDSITIVNYQSYNNFRSGLQIGLSRLPNPGARTLSVIAEHMDIDGSDIGILVGGFYKSYPIGSKVKGEISIRSVKISNTRQPVSLARNYQFGPLINFKNFNFYKGKSGKLFKDVEQESFFLKRLKEEKTIKIIQ
ncbi:MAG TPA: right-handed parallel beta-helix repeat-containing protein [Pedobacter sp.]|nr:right-handed parallel beta-helix repeat-containing protein [Pedobacter sp.]